VPTINLTDNTRGKYHASGYTYEHSATENVGFSCTVNTGSLGNWQISTDGAWNGIDNCSVSATSGSNGNTITITPDIHASSYAVFFRILNTPRAALLCGSISRASTPTATHGLEVYNSSGVKIISPDSWLTRFAASGTVTQTINAGATSSAINVSGMQNNNSWDVLISQVNLSLTSAVGYVVLNNITVNKYSGYFKITNNNSAGTSSSINNVNYLVTRV